MVERELLPPGEGFERFAERVADRVRHAPGVAAAESEHVSVGGTVATWHAFDVEASLRPPLRQFLLAWTKDGRGFTASVATPRPVTDELRDEIRRLLDLELLEDTAAPATDPWAEARVGWQDVRSRF